jgi:hypothetical protein
MSPPCEDPHCNCSCGKENAIRRAQADLDRVQSIARNVEHARERLVKMRRSLFGWLFLDANDIDEALEALAIRSAQVAAMVEDAQFEMDVVRVGPEEAKCNRAMARISRDVEADVFVGLSRQLDLAAKVKEEAKKLDLTKYDTTRSEDLHDLYAQLSTEELRLHLVAALEAWNQPTPVK